MAVVQTHATPVVAAGRKDWSRRYADSVQGRALLESAPEAAQDRLIVSLSQLKKSELETLSRLLGKVVEGADAAQQAPSLFFEEGPTLVTKGRTRNG